MSDTSDIAALKAAVMKLAGNKIDIVDFNNINNLHISRYLDLHTAYANLITRVEAIELWIANRNTGNSA